jgi:SSS family solute:Na+ symporter
VAARKRASLSGWADWIESINFLHFAILLLVLCAVVLVIVSLATQPPDERRVAPPTIQRAGQTPQAEPSRAADIALRVVLAGLAALAWLYFA